MTFDGCHYKLDGLEALPRPVQTPRPPILVGGGGPRMLDLAARCADIVGLHARLGPAGFDQRAAEELSRVSIERKIDLVASAASRAGRPAPEHQFTCYDVNIEDVQVTPIRPSFSDYLDANRAKFANSPTSLRGSASKCVDDLLRWTEELKISFRRYG